MERHRLSLLAYVVVLMDTGAVKRISWIEVARLEEQAHLTGGDAGPAVGAGDFVDAGERNAGADSQFGVGHSHVRGAPTWLLGQQAAVGRRKGVK